MKTLVFALVFFSDYYYVASTDHHTRVLGRANQSYEQQYVTNQRDWMRFFGVKLTVTKNKGDNEYKYSVKDNRPQMYDGTSIQSNETPRNLIAKIWSSARRSNKSTKAISSLIADQKAAHLINWATLYELKPVGQLQYVNIEFDHIPPGSSNPFDKTTKIPSKTRKKWNMVLRERRQQLPYQTLTTEVFFGKSVLLAQEQKRCWPNTRVSLR